MGNSRAAVAARRWEPWVEADVFAAVGRHPNSKGSAQTKPQTEEDALLEEFAYSPAFKLFLGEIVVPIAVDIRTQLLRSTDISESKRANLVGQLDLLERIFEALYGRTTAGVVPEAITNFFR